jgi:hypothetical protein
VRRAALPGGEGLHPVSGDADKTRSVGVLEDKHLAAKRARFPRDFGTAVPPGKKMRA